MPTQTEKQIIDTDKKHFICREVPAMMFKKYKVQFLGNTATCSSFALDQLLVKYYHKKLEMEVTFFDSGIYGT